LLSRIWPEFCFITS